MKRKDTIFVTKVVDRGNEGAYDVRYNVSFQDIPGYFDNLEFWRLEGLAEFLARYVKEEKEGGAK